MDLEGVKGGKNKQNISYEKKLIKVRLERRRWLRKKKRTESARMGKV